MILELHRPGAGKTLVGAVVEIESLGDAEKWVKETLDYDYAVKVVRWELKLGGELVCLWERPKGSSDFPKISRNRR